MMLFDLDPTYWTGSGSATLRVGYDRAGEQAEQEPRRQGAQPHQPSQVRSTKTEIERGKKISR